MYVVTSAIDKLALPVDLARQESVVTIGSFDGIHLGHQALIQRMVRKASSEDRLSGLITFYPHPIVVLSPRHTTLYLTTPGEKTALLEPLGLDWLGLLHFTEELAATSTDAFVRSLHKRVNMRDLWVGPDFALGRHREGDIPTLKHLGREIGFDVHVSPSVTSGNTRISSTRIRTLLRHGHVAAAARLLGRYYTVFGEVVQGAQRGRCIGFPTANVDVRRDRVVPAHGVYATFARLGKDRYQAVTNVGVRPSFDNGTPSVEAHLLDFAQDIYGCDLVLEFVARLRPERRFSNIKDLGVQIGLDVVKARELLHIAPRALPTVEGHVTLEKPTDL